jgi:hypothetical protein
MYRRQRRHLYYGAWWNLETLFAPLNRSSPFIGQLRCQAIQMEHALILQRGPNAQSILWDVCGSISLRCVSMHSVCMYCISITANKEHKKPCHPSLPWIFLHQSTQGTGYIYHTPIVSSVSISNKSLTEQYTPTSIIYSHILYHLYQYPSTIIPCQQWTN